MFVLRQSDGPLNRFVGKIDEDGVFVYVDSLEEAVRFPTVTAVIRALRAAPRVVETGQQSVKIVRIRSDRWTVDEDVG